MDPKEKDKSKNATFLASSVLKGEECYRYDGDFPEDMSVNSKAEAMSWLEITYLFYHFIKEDVKKVKNRKERQDLLDCVDLFEARTKYLHFYGF